MCLGLTLYLPGPGTRTQEEDRLAAVHKRPQHYLYLFFRKKTREDKELEGGHAQPRALGGPQKAWDRPLLWGRGTQLMNAEEGGGAEGKRQVML